MSFNEEKRVIKKKVLIVDDDAVIVSLIKDTLASSYDIFGAYSGNEALRTIEKENVDIVIADIMLTKEMNGYELCKQIKSKKQTAHIPIMMLSARKEMDDKLDAVYAGADDYMSKPFSTEELSKRVRLNLNLLKRNL